MVQITFTTSLIAAVVACAYFADATPIEKDLNFGQGYIKEETRPFQNVYEFKPLDYEPYGRKYYDQKYYNHGDFHSQPYFEENREFQHPHKNYENQYPHKNYENQYPHKHYEHQHPHKYYKDGGRKYYEDKEIKHDVDEHKFKKDKDHEDKIEAQKYYENKYHNDKYHDHKDENDIKKEKDIKAVDKKQKDHKYKEGFETEFDKSSYELGYGEFFQEFCLPHL